MARPRQDGFPTWKPRRVTVQKIKSDNLKERYKALRNASSNFIKRKDVRNYILSKYNNRCYICGSSCDLQVDHIISVYKFATEKLEPFLLNSEDNLAAICKKCNSAKRPDL